MSGSKPKTMSSRLMTMKFMQRGAAKSIAASPSTTNGPHAKKTRLSNGTSVPGTPGTPDHEILQSALAAEEQKRQEALDKAAQYTGETKWVLSFTDPLDGKRHRAMQVRQAGFAEIDANDTSEEDEDEARPIRMQFGGGLKKQADVRITEVEEQSLPVDKTQKSVPVEAAEDSEGEVEPSSEEHDSDDPAAALIRDTKREVAEERREARKARTSTSTGYKPPNGDSSLGGLTSISGGRQPSGRDLSHVECFKCGQKGHMQDSCPKPRGSAGRGRGRGRR